MGEEHESGHPEPTPDTAPVPEGIPLARPVAPPYASPIAASTPEILLLGSTRKAVWADLGAVIVILAGFELCAQTVLAFVTGVVNLPFEVPDAEVTRIMLIPLLPARAALTFVVIALALRSRRQSYRSVGVGRQGLGIDLLLGVGAMTTAYGIIIMWMGITWLGWPEAIDELSENADQIMSLVPRQSPLGFLLLALLIGLYEEVLFRGFIMTRLRRATGSWTLAVLLSTVVFVAPHMIDQVTMALIPITILSVVFSLVTIWRHSIVPAIVGHWLFNLSQFLSLYFFEGESWT